MLLWSEMIFGIWVFLVSEDLSGFERFIYIHVENIVHVEEEELGGDLKKKKKSYLFLRGPFLKNVHVCVPSYLSFYLSIYCPRKEESYMNFDVTVIFVCVWVYVVCLCMYVYVCVVPFEYYRARVLRLCCPVSCICLCVCFKCPSIPVLSLISSLSSSWKYTSNTKKSLVLATIFRRFPKDCVEQRDYLKSLT